MALDEPVATAAEYAAARGATYTVVGDPFRRGIAAYPIASLPTHVLIDREGIVRDVVIAALDEEQSVARAEVILASDGSR